jgi:cytochrome c2
MDTQKTLIKALELFRTLAIIYGLSWVVFVSTAFYYINNQSSEPPPTIMIDNISANLFLSELGVRGETLFKSNCSQCHSTKNEQIVGPGLQGIQQRKKLDWIRKWIRNSQKVLVSKDKYANELFEKYNKTPMIAFPDFKDKDIDAILKYIEEVNQ